MHSFADAAPVPDLEDLQQKWPEVLHGLHRWLEDLLEADLATDLTCIKPDGEEFRAVR